MPGAILGRRSAIVRVAAGAALLVLSLTAGGLPSALAAACTSAVLATVTPVEVVGGEAVALQVSLQASGAGNTIRRVGFASAVNGTVVVGGATRAIPASVAIDPPAAGWSFVLRKTTRGAPFMVNYVATDACGDVPKFAGSGMAPVAAIPAPTTPTPTPTPTATPAPALRILSPRPGETVTGPTVQVTWEVEGVEIVPAAQAQRREDRHAHVLLDQDLSQYVGTSRPFPTGNPKIVHTASRTVTLDNVTAGSHRLDLVLGYRDHVAATPPPVASVSFTVAAGGGTPPPTPTPTPTPPPTVTNEALISNFIYSPDPVQARVGEAVRWTNWDAAEHTATAVNQSWTTPVLTQNQSASIVFTQPGSYEYFCEPHPQMRGELIVQP